MVEDDVRILRARIRSLEDPPEADDASASLRRRRLLGALRAVCLAFAEGSRNRRRAIAELVERDGAARDRLLGFLRDAGRMLAATRHETWLRCGLAAAAIAGPGQNPRAFLEALADLFVATESAGFDAARMFEVAAEAGEGVVPERFEACECVAAARRAGRVKPFTAQTNLTAALRAASPDDAAEARSLAHIREFVTGHARPFDRSIFEGHLTASAVILSMDGSSVLLVRHRKLGIWLQPGGHGERNERQGEAIALREAAEESGLSDLVLHPLAPRPFDVDVHEIPARPHEAGHQHLDLRYLVLASRDAALRGQPSEVADVRWCSWHEVEDLALDVGLRRALAKGRAWMGLTT